MTKAALLDEIAGLNRQLGAARSQGLEDRAHVRDQVLHQPHRTWAKMIRLLLPRMGGGSASGGDSFDSECAHGVTSCDACTDASSTRTREAEQLRGLLREWRQTPFFSDEDDWKEWRNALAAKVDAALGEEKP